MGHARSIRRRIHLRGGGVIDTVLKLGSHLTMLRKGARHFIPIVRKGLNKFHSLGNKGLDKLENMTGSLSAEGSRPVSSAELTKLMDDVADSMSGRQAKVPGLRAPVRSAPVRSAPETRYDPIHGNKIRGGSIRYLF